MMDQNDFLGVGYYCLINFRAKFGKLSPVEPPKIRRNAEIVTILSKFNKNPLISNFEKFHLKKF